VATAAGAAVGGTAGGIIGALTQAGTSQEDAYLYAEGVRRGGTLVSARVADADRARYEAVLDRSAVNIRDRGTAWRKAGWQNFDPKAKPYIADEIRKDVAHDFNNLLTVVLGNLQFIEKRGFGNSSDSTLKQRLSHIRIAAERGAKLTSQLLAFSRRQHLDPKPVDLNDALGHMSDLLQSSLGGSVQIKTMFRPGLWRALVDASQIELVVLNLAINARDASPVGSTITLETANATVGPPEKPEEPQAGEYVVVSVTDNGSGMAKDVLAKAFEPFFTTKEIGKGSGLGLSQALGFAKQSGGGMRIESRVGEGTSVKVYLPRTGEFFTYKGLLYYSSFINLR
jgi:signal transduction histidine kinase